MQINWVQYFTVLMDGIRVQNPFNLTNEIVSVTDLGYFLNLASVLANARLETIREYSFCATFICHPQIKSFCTEMTLNDG